jgi:type I restriction enzyme R subunit
LGQIIDFTDPLLERLYVFARGLNRKLPKRKTAGLPQEIFDEVDLDSFRIQKRYEGHIKLLEEDGELSGISSEIGSVREPEVDYLSSIIETLNETFGLDLDNRDKIRLRQIVEDVESDESIQAVMNGNNTMTNKRTHVNSVIDQKILDQVNESIDLYQKLSEVHVSETIKRQLFDKLLAQVE